MAVELQFPKCFACDAFSHSRTSQVIFRSVYTLGSRPLIALSTISLKTLPLLIVSADNLYSGL